MKIGNAFPSKNLKAADLNDKPVRVTILRVKIEEVGTDKEQKPVVYFRGKEKGLVLNKTNSRSITKIAGTDETDRWTGVEIVLYPTETEFAGETVDCIRVRPLKAATRVVQPPPPDPEPEVDEEAAQDFHASDDDVPF